MTADHVPLAHTELASLLAEAAQSISGIPTTEYPTPASRSYLHPVLGALSAGPWVVSALAARLEGFLNEPLPATPVGLFALASYASALGWLTESLAELTASVEAICTGVGIPVEPLTQAVVTSSPQEQEQDEFHFGFSSSKLATIRTAAEAAGLTVSEYVKVLSQSLLVAAHITDACMEVSSGLLEDAAYVLGETADHVHIGNGPDGLPTLVRSLLAHLETAE